MTVPASGPVSSGPVSSGTVSSGTVSSGDIRAALRGALSAALKARDLTAAAALRSALGAIGNAEATTPAPSAPVGSGPAASSPHVAGAVAGLGAAEAGRRELSPEQLAGIVGAEIGERLAAAADYDRAGRPDRAARLRHEAQVLRTATGVAPGPGADDDASAAARPDL